MTSRAIAPSNQWKEATGSVVTVALMRAHPDFAGFVTVADTGTATTYMVADAVHTGFATPDDAAASTDSIADFIIFGGGLATLVGTT
jgi:hypothetical protein